MKRNIYVVWDRVALAALPTLMLFAHDAPAIRQFQEILQDSQSQLSKHPADFDLYCLGEFHETENRLESLDEGRLVILGSSCVEAQS